MIPVLILDFYKTVHSSQYPKGLTKMVSYYTPRMSRLKDVDKVTLFGLQGFIKEYLCDMFNTHFFCRGKRYVVDEYNRVLTYTLGPGTYDSQKIKDLWDLGYLPLEIRAVPEGTRTAIGVPQIEISNTHPNFVWLVNTIETMLSATMWHTQVSAEVGYRYRQIVQAYHDLTCDDEIPVSSLLGDFSMRGQQSVESATKSSAAWLLSFRNTATVPAIPWLEENYNCNCTKDIVGLGAISTEHSVMCSNYAIDGNEVAGVRRLLTKIYPHNNFSMVSDSYDYWNLVTNILPQLKEEILAHDGCLSIRGDSGDPVDIIAGIPYIRIPSDEMEDPETDMVDWLWEYYEGGKGITNEYKVIAFWKDKIYRVYIYPCWTNERGSQTSKKYWYIENFSVTFDEIDAPSAEEAGTVETLWNLFGGTTNSKGYKVLNPHVKAIYGDSITPQRCEEIYSRLEAKGFAINNVSLGVGSFSFMCLETYDDNGDVHYSPYTRDTFGIAVKATYAEDADGKPIMIYKQPKALSWKKSQKGCCIVSLDGQSYTDEHTWDEVQGEDNLLHTVFIDGNMKNETTLNEVRERMYGGNW